MAITYHRKRWQGIKDKLAQRQTIEGAMAVIVSLALLSDIVGGIYCYKFSVTVDNKTKLNTLPLTTLKSKGIHLNSYQHLPHRSTNSLLCSEY